MLSRNFGIFEISVEAINEHPAAVRAIMGTCIVVRAEMIYSKNVVEYHALCDDFLEVEEGYTPPRYDLEFDDETGVVTWVLTEQES